METHSVELVGLDLDNSESITWSTDINGDKGSIGLYFMSHKFNLGKVEDKMIKVHHLIFDDGSRLSRCPNPKCFEYVSSKGHKIRNSLNRVLQNMKD